MGLDMYLGSYHKAKLNKKVFNAKETEKLKDGDNDYSVFDQCPDAFKDIATEIKVVNQYYDMEKISKTFANGEPLTIGGYGSGQIYFRNYEKNIKLDLDSEVIHKDYLVSKEETAYVIEGDYEIAYWRKANQIRQWFVDHIDEFNEDDNGDYYKVTKELLEQLVKDCEITLNNHNLAKEILPTSSGFFFGGTDYDEWYYEQLENTVQVLTEVIAETDWDNEVVTYHEWW